ncbi:unnamed protein product [Orchesella dallaii]|uniref:Uncharacterized protein n=1 Tax=Orchesella dallaii TaxID=48710 RepID=A0ABP1PTL7_9HEXA
MLLIQICIVCLLIVNVPTAATFSLYNDLDEMYVDSEEADGVYLQNYSRGRKLQEGIVDIASIILLNMSQICPINQTNYFNFAEKLVSSSLNEIHEPGHGREGEVAYYEATIPIIQRFLQGCAQKLPKITNKALKRAMHPKKIIHLDLFKEPVNTSKWQDFRHCVRATRKANFYPSVISYVVDTLWQSFLLGYFGCKEHYNSSLDTWIYINLFETLILHPILQHWNSTFPLITPIKLKQNEVGTIYLVEESHVVVPKSLKKGTLSQEEISLKLEKCNVNLYLKYSVDPIPCFEM